MDLEDISRICIKNIGYIESTGQCFVKGEEVQDNQYYKWAQSIYTFGRYFSILKDMEINIYPEFLKNF